MALSRHEARIDGDRRLINIFSPSQLLAVASYIPLWAFLTSNWVVNIVLPEPQNDLILLDSGLKET